MISAARMLFDTGSLRTFITEALYNKLNLTPVGYDKVSMAGFGDQQRKITPE